MNLERIKGMLLNPRKEWSTVASDVDDMRALYVNYIVSLAAIGPAASFLGLAVIGVPAPIIGTYRPPLGANLAAQLSSFVFELLAVWLLSLLASAMAPRFGGRADKMAALRLVAYALTPVWVGAALYLVPPLSPLALIADLYGVYLLYLGAPVMLDIPKDRSYGFYALIFVAALVLSIVSVALSSSYYNLT